MTIEEAKVLAQAGAYITHPYFADDEYFTMKGNIMVFEDGVEMFFNDFLESRKSWVYDDQWIQFVNKDVFQCINSK